MSKKQTVELVKSIVRDDRGTSNMALKRMIGQKVNNILDSRRIQAAQNMFKSKED